MKIWELREWLYKQDQMAEIEICTEPESGKYVPFEAERNIVVDKDRKQITIFCC